VVLSRNNRVDLPLKTIVIIGDHDPLAVFAEYQHRSPVWLPSMPHGR
jgi:hypothetical protein